MQSSDNPLFDPELELLTRQSLKSSSDSVVVRSLGIGAQNILLSTLSVAGKY